MDKFSLFKTVEEERDRLEDVARRLWETPETALNETESAGLLVDELDGEGFDVTEGVGGLPTAFVAEYGSGRPRIGMIGEYDALPSLSQHVSATRDPVEEDGPGHGCGHNLFASGSLGGTLAVKRAIDAGEVDGTVVFLGCPAEETLVGKVFMARAGAFDDLDAALAWHPSRTSSPFMGETIAMNSVEYTFEGESAHASTAPDSGRSALDAIQLMNTGTEYMREHVSNDARVHYSITDGGDVPNVVPAEATVWYFLRAPSRESVEALTDWVDEIAAGAARMTRTDVERNFVTGCYGFRPNDRLTEVVRTNQEAAGPIPFSDADEEFARELKETVPEDERRAQMANVPEDRREEVLERDLLPEPQESFDRGTVRYGSTDVGDVSWITPLAQFWGAAWPVGVPSHTWQAVAANGSFGVKTAVFAAKVLAGTAYDVFTDESVLAEVRAEFEETTAGREYESPLPPGTEPPTPSE